MAELIALILPAPSLPPPTSTTLSPLLILVNPVASVRVRIVLFESITPFTLIPQRSTFSPEGLLTPIISELEGPSSWLGITPAKDVVDGSGFAGAVPEEPEVVEMGAPEPEELWYMITELELMGVEGVQVNVELKVNDPAAFCVNDVGAVATVKA